MFTSFADGTEFIPGTVGLNNLKNTVDESDPSNRHCALHSCQAYLNVIIQALSCVTELRNFFLLPEVCPRRNSWCGAEHVVELQALQEPAGSEVRRAA